MGERCAVRASAMVSMKLRYIVEDVDRHGNVRIYFRRNGKKTRMREHLGSQDFYIAYGALVRNAGQIAACDRTPKPHSLRWLCVQFFRSIEYKQLDPRTQYTRRRIIEGMLQEPIAPGASQ